jgi:MFS transporter, AAHS family, 3-hydroxyphenylpropionic acid transporter
MNANTAAPRIAVTLALCFCAAVLEGYDVQAFGIAAPKLVAALGLDPARQGWAASTAMVGLVLGAFLGGRIADTIGRKPVLLASVALFGLCSIWTGLSTSFASLLLARLATGIGFGGAFPVLIAVAAEVSSPSRRGATTSALFSGMPAGGALVSLLASIAGGHMDWRTIFILGGAMPLVLLPLLWLFLPETRPETRPGRDEDASAALLAVLFAQGRALATVLLASASLLILVLLYMVLNWLPSLMVAKGFLPGDGAAAAFAFNIAAVGGTVLLGFVMDIAGARRTLAVSYLALFASVYLLGTASSASSAIAFSAVAGFFTVGISCALYGLAPSYYPPWLRAAACGAIVGIGRIGTIAGPLLAGQLRQQGWSAEHVIDAMLPLIFVGGVAALLLPRARDREAGLKRAYSSRPDQAG